MRSQVDLLNDFRTQLIARRLQPAHPCVEKVRDRRALVFGVEHLRIEVVIENIAPDHARHRFGSREAASRD